MNLELLKLVEKALKDDTEGTQALFMNQWTVDAVRSNDKRPAKVEFYCPDDWVKNLTGNGKLKDVFVVVRVDRGFVDKHIDSVSGMKTAMTEEPPSTSAEQDSPNPAQETPAQV